MTHKNISKICNINVKHMRALVLAGFYCYVRKYVYTHKKFIMYKIHIYIRPNENSNEPTYLYIFMLIFMYYTYVRDRRTNVGSPPIYMLKRMSLLYVSEYITYT